MWRSLARSADITAPWVVIDPRPRRSRVDVLHAADDRVATGWLTAWPAAWRALHLTR